ncbi:Nucleotide-diphospho-sugar transferase, partial [Cynara cardunculus var. scolymus]
MHSMGKSCRTKLLFGYTHLKTICSSASLCLGLRTCSDHLLPSEFYNCRSLANGFSTEIGTTTISMVSTTDSTRRSRITIAILVGVLLGCIFTFYYPHGLFVFYPPISVSGIAANSNSQMVSGKCESSKRINFLKAEFALSIQINSALQKQIRDLTEKLRLAEEKKHQVPKQVFVFGEQPKAGPFGTVKGLRTNPIVSPNESINSRLATILIRIAFQQELIVTLANSNAKEMLEFWFNNIKRLGISNYLVVALDQEIAKFCQENVFRLGRNHGVSRFKFRILREFLQLGYSVLFSDIDVIYLQNPFMYLRRDSDVESITDGHNNMTAYGYDDVFNEPSMGWARYAHSIRISVYYTGFFYIRATIPSIELLDHVFLRLSQEPKSWDQVVFNEELFYPSYPGCNGLYASKRTLDFLLFMNSKVLFEIVRKSSWLRMMVKPVIVHVNYYRDKLSILKGIKEYY